MAKVVEISVTSENLKSLSKGTGLLFPLEDGSFVEIYFGKEMKSEVVQKEMNISTTCTCDKCKSIREGRIR